MNTLYEDSFKYLGDRSLKIIEKTYRNGAHKYRTNHPLLTLHANGTGKSCSILMIIEMFHKGVFNHHRNVSHRCI